MKIKSIFAAIIASLFIMELSASSNTDMSSSGSNTSNGSSLITLPRQVAHKAITSLLDEKGLLKTFERKDGLLEIIAPECFRPFASPMPINEDVIVSLCRLPSSTDELRLFNLFLKGPYRFSLVVDNVNELSLRATDLGNILFWGALNSILADKECALNALVIKDWKRFNKRQLSPDVFGANKSLTGIYFVNTELSGDYLQQFTKRLRDNETLKSLCFDGCSRIEDPEDEGAIALASMIKSNKRFTHVSVRGTFLDNGIAKIFGEAVVNNCLHDGALELFDAGFCYQVKGDSVVDLQIVRLITPIRINLLGLSLPKIPLFQKEKTEEATANKMVDAAIERGLFNAESREAALEMAKTAIVKEE